MSFQTINRQRLTAHDLYHFIDWVRDGWDDDDLLVTPRLQRLRWHLEELPEPYQSRALEQYLTLTEARLIRDVPWRDAMEALLRIVSDWNRSRPQLRTCGIGGCQISYRSPEALLQHRVLVHGAST